MKALRREGDAAAGEYSQSSPQGADISDLDWLIETGARLAVVSIDPNSYGHPSETLLADLAGTGMTIRRTDEGGEVE